MRIIGCDLHARQQTLAMLDTETGEVVILTLMHEGDQVREFYSELPRPVLVGIEAIGVRMEGWRQGGLAGRERDRKWKEQNSYRKKPKTLDRDRPSHGRTW